MEDRIRKELNWLKDRYFRPVIAYPEGHLCHYGNCHVHRSIEMHGTAPCNCGFLMDLSFLGESIKMKLHPDFYEEQAKEEPVCTPEEKQAAEILFEKIFGKPLEDTRTEENKEQDRRMEQIKNNMEWSLIEEVFGKAFRERKETEWRGKLSVE